MNSDVNDVFNEKQLYIGDVVCEDGEPTFDSSASGHPRAAAAASVGLAGGAAAVGAGGVVKAETAAQRRQRRKKQRAVQIVYWLETRYDILHEVCSSFECWKEAPSVSYDFDLLWCDCSISAERFMKLKAYQKMNHFVGMSSITRKNNLGRNLLRMRKQFPKEYRFFPDTWILPTDLSDFKQQFNGAKGKTFIIKPDNGCQGKGIFLIRDVEKVPVDFSTTSVAQRYLNKPFLLDGCKFDLRLYVLVVGCDPLRIFLHKRGLVRLATGKYEEPTKKNLEQTTMHLTNYAVNKFAAEFQENSNPDDAHDGHKRSWEAVHEHLRSRGHDVDTLLAEIEDLIIKTLIAVQPSLSHFYHSCQPDDAENGMCFEILGFDVMMDQKLQPWLLEVNHAPSFGADSELDRIVKYEVLSDSMNLLNLSPEARRAKKREAKEKMEQRTMGVVKKQSLEERMQLEQDIAIERTAWEDMHTNGYKRLFPSAEKEREYMPIHDAAINIWETLMGGTSRRCVRITQKIEPVEEAVDRKAKVESRKIGGLGLGGEDAERPPEQKRTAEEIREAVERLAAGCSARPRASAVGGGSSRRRRSREDAVQAAPPPQPSDGPSDDDAEDGEAAGAAEEGQTKRPPGRPEVQVGDIVKVQTNLGWESVTVKSKRNNGKLDIQFKDGEYMRSVLPRILRDQSGAAPQYGPPVAAGSSGERVEAEAPAASHVGQPGASAVAGHPASAAGRPSGGRPLAATSGSHRGNLPLLPACSPVPPIADASGTSVAPVTTADLESSVVRAMSAFDRTARSRAAAVVSGGGFTTSGASGARGPSADRTSGARGPSPSTVPAADPNRVHEARLRQQLQHLISVRPVVTHRKPSHDSDLPQSSIGVYDHRTH